MFVELFLALALTTHRQPCVMEKCPNLPLAVKRSAERPPSSSLVCGMVFILGIQAGVSASGKRIHAYPVIFLRRAFLWRSGTKCEWWRFNDQGKRRTRHYTRCVQSAEYRLRFGGHQSPRRIGTHWYWMDSNWTEIWPKLDQNCIETKARVKLN